MSNSESSLLETLCAPRHRSTQPLGVFGYDVARQQQIYTVDGQLLPGEVQASDGAGDTVKIIDKVAEEA